MPKKNDGGGLKLAVLFVAMVAGIGVVILAGAALYSAITEAIANTPDQAVALGTYVQTAHITPEQAQSALTLAQADATVRHEQTDRYRAQTERMAAEDDRVRMLKDVIGTPKLNDVLAIFGGMCALGLLLIVLISRKRKVTP